MKRFRLGGGQHKHDKKQASHKNKAFTLVELIVVVVIIAILIGVAIKGLRSYVTTSKRNTDVSNAATMEKAMTSLAYDDELCEFLEGETLGESYTMTWKKPSDVTYSDNFPDTVKNKIFEMINNELPESQSKKGFTLTATNTTTGLDVTISSGTTVVENPIEIAQGNTGGTGSGSGTGSTGTGTGSGTGTGGNNTSGGTNNTGNGAQAPTKPDDTVEDNTGDLEYITPSGVVEYYGDGSLNQTKGSYYGLMRVNMKNIESTAKHLEYYNKYDSGYDSGNTHYATMQLIQEDLAANGTTDYYAIGSGFNSPYAAPISIDATNEDKTVVVMFKGDNSGTSTGFGELKFYINDELRTLKQLVQYGYIKPNVHIGGLQYDTLLNIYDGGYSHWSENRNIIICFTLNKGAFIDDIRFISFRGYNSSSGDGLYVYTRPASELPVRIKKVTS